MQIIAICNLKGGCAKTTTTLNLAACLAEEGKKVLMIDSDVQGNLTLSIGVSNDKKTLLDCFRGDYKLKDIIIKGTLIENLDLIPCNSDYSNLSGEFWTEKNNTTLLKNALEKEDLNYDYIIIDSSPSLDISVLNNLNAADKVLVAMEPGLFNIQGLTELYKTMNLIKKVSNKNIELGGILHTRIDRRTTLLKESKNDLSKSIFADKLLTTEIYQSSVVARSQMAGLPLNLYDPKSKIAKEYKNLAKEILEKW